MIDPHSQGTVHVIDDEPGIRQALRRLLEIEGFTVHLHASATEFLSRVPEFELIPACLILDVSMPGMDGLELQQALTKLSYPHSIIFLTGRGTIPMGVRAMKNGATDFLTKPVGAEDLLPAVWAALAQAAALSLDQNRKADLTARHRSLTEREKQVMAMVVAGAANKVIAQEFGTGEQNIKIHRGRVMQKMGVTSVAALVRAAVVLEIAPPVRNL